MNQAIDLIKQYFDIGNFLTNGINVDKIKINDLKKDENNEPLIYSYPIIPITYNLMIIQLLDLLPEEKQPKIEGLAKYYLNKNDNVGLFKYDKLLNFIKNEGINSNTLPTIIHNLSMHFYVENDKSAKINDFLYELVENNDLVSLEGTYYEERGNSLVGVLQECLVRYSLTMNDKQQYYDYGQEYLFNELKEILKDDEMSFNFLHDVIKTSNSHRDNISLLLTINEITSLSIISDKNFENCIKNGKYRTTSDASSRRKLDNLKNYIEYVIKNNVNTHKVEQFVLVNNNYKDFKDFRYTVIKSSLLESINSSISISDIEDIKNKYQSDFN